MLINKYKQNTEHNVLKKTDKYTFIFGNKKGMKRFFL